MRKKQPYNDKERLRHQKWVDANRERLNAWRRSNYSRKKEKFSEKNRKQYAKLKADPIAYDKRLEGNATAVRRYRQKRQSLDPNFYSQQSREWRAKNPDKARSWREEYMLRKGDQIREQSREYKRDLKFSEPEKWAKIKARMRERRRTIPAVRIAQDARARRWRLKNLNGKYAEQKRKKQVRRRNAKLIKIGSIGEKIGQFIRRRK